MLSGLRAKLYAVGAALVLGLLAALKIAVLQKKAAQEDARRAKKHLTEVKEIREAEKEIKKVQREETKKAVESIKNGEVPDIIRNRNDF